MDPEQTAAAVLVRELRTHRVDRIFCVPGESFLDVLDALADQPDIAVTTCRHEGGAAMMAEAYGKLTGRPGIVFVTRGPGATNAGSGIHVADQDATPLIVFVGQVERSSRGRRAFQEIDLKSVFSSLSKWATEIDDGARIPETVARAFKTATSGRPGPVVIGLPEDMLGEAVAAAPARADAPVRCSIGQGDAAEIGAALAGAVRPVLVLGGGSWSDEAAGLAADFARAWNLPVATSFRCQDFVDNQEPGFVGTLGLGANPALLEAIRDSDAVVAIGARFDDVSSGGYSLLGIPQTEQMLIQIGPAEEEIGQVYQPALGIVSDPVQALRALVELAPRPRETWKARTEALRRSFEAWTTPGAVPGALQLGEVVRHLQAVLPPEAIVTNGAGNFAIWPNRYYRYRRFGTMLAPRSGSMGYAIPAAVAAKLVRPSRTVVAFTGDGDFLMTGQELATALKEDIQIIVLLVNNGMYGTIRMHQERAFPGRVSGTGLVNPDFVKLAQAYGAHGERVARTEDFAPALDRAMASGRSAVIELVPDPDILSPDATISSLRSASGAT